MPKKTMSDPVVRAWEKLAKTSWVDRVGAIPVFDNGQWRTFRNQHTIYAGAENCADPAKVEQLRQNVESLYRAYPQTMEQLEKLGIRVKRLVARPIKTQADVTAWATSIFNVGPMTYPEHIYDTFALAYEDFPIRVPHKEKTYVVPDQPRGSGVAVLRDFNEPGSKITFGPRHPYTKVVLAGLPGWSVRGNNPPSSNGEKTPRRPTRAHRVVTATVPPPEAPNGSESPTGASESIPTPDPDLTPDPPRRRGRLQSVA